MFLMGIPCEPYFKGFPYRNWSLIRPTPVQERDTFGWANNLLVLTTRPETDSFQFEIAIGTRCRGIVHFKLFMDANPDVCEHFRLMCGKQFTHSYANTLFYHLQPGCKFIKTWERYFTSSNSHKLRSFNICWKRSCNSEGAQKLLRLESVPTSWVSCVVWTEKSTNWSWLLVIEKPVLLQYKLMDPDTSLYLLQRTV